MTVLSPETFRIDPRLVADTRPVASMALCELLLCNDARYLWCILVPRVTDLRDWHDVPKSHKNVLHDEIDRVSLALKALTNADKMNVASLGNLVAQLHIHVVARHHDDAAWPGPIWGVGQAQAYAPEAGTRRIDALRTELAVE